MTKVDIDVPNGVANQSKSNGPVDYALGQLWVGQVCQLVVSLSLDFEPHDALGLHQTVHLYRWKKGGQ